MPIDSTINSGPVGDTGPQGDTGDAGAQPQELLNLIKFCLRRIKYLELLNGIQHNRGENITPREIDLLGSEEFLE